MHLCHHGFAPLPHHSGQSSDVVVISAASESRRAVVAAIASFSASTELDARPSSAYAVLVHSGAPSASSADIGTHCEKYTHSPQGAHVSTLPPPLTQSSRSVATDVITWKKAQSSIPAQVARHRSICSALGQLRSIGSWPSSSCSSSASDSHATPCRG